MTRSTPAAAVAGGAVIALAARTQGDAAELGIDASVTRLLTQADAPGNTVAVSARTRRGADTLER